MPPELLAQFPLVELALQAIGVVLWPMVEFEADDALGAAAARWAEDPAVERVVILSPDKDMAQCVREDGRVVTYDRRKRLFVDADGVREKFGVSPASIPDFLALVGDSSDGYPGIPGWGAVSTAAVLRRYPHLEDIPESVRMWDVGVRGAATLATALRERRDEALLYRELALLRLDAPIPQRSVDELRWRGVPRAPFEALVELLAAPALRGRVPHWARLQVQPRSSGAGQQSVAWWGAGAATMPVARVARVRSNQGPPSIEVTVAPPSAAMRPAAAMSQSDRPRHWTKASNRPLPTHARPSAALPMERGTRTALRTASSRRAKPLGGRAMEMTLSPRSPSKAWMALAVHAWRPGPRTALNRSPRIGSMTTPTVGSAADDQRHAGAEVGDAGGVVDRAVQWVDDPDPVARIDGGART